MPINLVPPIAVADNGGSITRSGNATFVGSNGHIQTATTGVIRYNYDSLSLLGTGILFETAATNLCLYSEDFTNASWTKVGGLSVTSNTDLAPDNATTSETLTGVAATTAYVESAAMTVAAATTYIPSVFLKAGTSPASLLRVMDGTGVTEIASATITWTAGVTTITATTGTWSTAPTVLQYSNNHYRISGAISSGAFTSVVVRIYPSVANAATTVKAWGVNFCIGPLVTSYIQSVATAITRNAETISGTGLVYSNVPETDYAAWSGSAVAYTVGQRVVRTTATTHYIYECAVGHTSAVSPLPENNATQWTPVSPTNRYKPFDTSNSTACSQTGGISFMFTPGQVYNAVFLSGVSANSIRIREIDPVAGVTYDEVLPMSSVILAADWWYYYFSTITSKATATALDLPNYVNSSVLIDVIGAGTVTLATFIVGSQVPIGSTEINYGAKVGIVDYSGKTTNSFGDIVLTKRAYAKRASFEIMLNNGDVDGVQEIMAQYRATPCLWIGNDGFTSTQIFGIYQSFDVTIAYPTQSVFQLDLLGMT